MAKKKATKMDPGYTYESAKRYVVREGNAGDGRKRGWRGDMKGKKETGISSGK